MSHDSRQPAVQSRIDPTAAWFDALTAPSKQLVWFDKSGHEPFVDELDKFNRTKTDVVRPAVDAAVTGQKAA